MVGLEAAAATLGASIVKNACQAWLGDDDLAVDVSSTLTDMVAKRITGHFEQRKTARFFDDCADVVGRRLLKVIEAQYGAVPANERTAAMLAVSDVFGRARLSVRDVLGADLDPRKLEQRLEPEADAVRPRVALATAAEPVFDYLLRESCDYLVQVVMSLPSLAGEGTAELLERGGEVLGRLGEVLERLPQRRGTDDFEADYRRQVATLLDRMELFGARVHGPGRDYPLSVAYLSLRVSDWGDGPGTGITSDGRVEEVLAGRRRLTLVGEAGSGKTTLLRWLAVRSSRRDFPEPLREWSGTVPFFIPLRRFAGGRLPRPEQFLDEVAPGIAGEAQRGWVQSVLRSGRGLVLIDGIDEIPGRQRGDVEDWLYQLQVAFPDARYVITSRPEALSEHLAKLGDGEALRTHPDVRVGDLRISFQPRAVLRGLLKECAHLQPMTPGDIRGFVRQWHLAVREEIRDPAEHKELATYEQAVLAALESDRHLRRLAVNPLLCALLCALNRELRTQLPRTRMEIYDAALSMLIEQRDRERRVGESRIMLSRTQKTVLLQEIALWLLRNGRSDASTAEAAKQIAQTLPSFRLPAQHDPHEVLRHLLERSGVLREPVGGRVDFVHKTFQEYLAGKAAVEAEMLGELVNNAHDDQWREAVVMATGHARPVQCASLLTGLLKRIDGLMTRSPLRDPSVIDDRHRLVLTAVACLQTATQLVPEVRRDVERSASELMPPRSSEVARVLADAGDFVLDLLPYPSTDQEFHATLETARLIGGDDALNLIARVAAQPQWSRAPQRFVDAWESFDRERFAASVLSKVDVYGQMLRLLGPHEFELLRSIPLATAVRLPIRPSDRDFSFDGWRFPALEGLWIDFEGSDFEPHRVEFLEALTGKTVPALRSLTLDSPPPLLRAIGVRAQVHELTIGRWSDLDNLDALADFTELRGLSLALCDLGEVSLKPLQHLRHLHHLYLDGGVRWRPDLQLLTQLPALEHLIIEECENVDLSRITERPAFTPGLTLTLRPDQAMTKVPHGGSRVRIELRARPRRPIQ